MLRLQSGRDTTLEGAQAYGNTILADIGRSLSLTSTQDTDHYKETYQSASAGLSLCIPPICYGATSGGASYSQSNISNNYQSVTDQTGLAAGSGGFDIHVGDTTTLTGAAIASTADPSKNLLDTGSLIVNDLHNSAHSSASQMGFSYSSSNSAASNAATNAMGAALNMAVPQGGSDSSDTASSIAQGTIVVRDNPDQDLSGIDRSATTLNGNGVSNDFDVDKIRENQSLGQAAGYVGMRAAGSLADRMYMQAAASGDTEAMAAWRDGGVYKTLLHGLVGAATAELGDGDAAQGALGAAASEAASGAMVNYLTGHHIDPNSAEGKTLMQLASAAVGGVAGGGSGAATALDGEKYNRQLHSSEIAWLQENGKAYAQAQCHCDNPDDAAIQTATQQLAQQALRQVDTKWAEVVGEQDDPAAKAWLATHAPEGTVGYSSDAYFTATEAERNNPYMYFGSLDQNEANREFVQSAAGVDKSNAVGNAQGFGVGLKNWGVGTAQGLWDLAKTVGSANPVDQLGEGVEQWKFLFTDPEGYADAVKTQVGAGAEAIAQSTAQGYVDTRLNSLYGGYSGSVAVVTFGLFQVLNPEEKVAVLAQLSREGKLAKLAELESDAAKAGKLDEFKVAEAAVAERVANKPKLTIRDHYDHHMNMVDDIKDQLSSQGYRVSDKEISFGDSCGTGRCRPGIVAEAPDGSIRIIEVKTGGADLSIRQSEIFPQIRDGNSIPRGKVARDFGLIPGKPLREQGYPNGIPIEMINFPGASR